MKNKSRFLASLEMTANQKEKKKAFSGGFAAAKRLRLSRAARVIPNVVRNLLKQLQVNDFSCLSGMLTERRGMPRLYNIGEAKSRRDNTFPVSTFQPPLEVYFNLFRPSNRHWKSIPTCFDVPTAIGSLSHKKNQK